MASAHSWLVFAIVGVAAFGVSNLSARATAADSPLISQSDLEYQGAFRLPAGPMGGTSFEYGGTAIAFNPGRDSLFLVGHDWQQLAAEVSIPPVRKGATLGDLAVATMLQPFADPTGGKRGLVGANVKIGGLLSYQDRLYTSVFVYYDANGNQAGSHFVADRNLAVSAEASGPHTLQLTPSFQSWLGGTLGAGFFGGYFALIPREWQDALGGPVLTGQCCLNIISRTSSGPAAFAIDPLKIGGQGPAPAVPLVYYPMGKSLDPRGDGLRNESKLFNATTEVTGAVFPEQTRSVLFFGRQGLGPFCYGEGTADPALDRQPLPGEPSVVYCHDAVYPGTKGNHAPPYAYSVWAYDAADLARVKMRIKQPWTVRPYATWTFELPFGNVNARISGATYDPQTGRIFVSAAYNDGDRPLIHVFTVRRNAPMSSGG